MHPGDLLVFFSLNQGPFDTHTHRAKERKKKSTWSGLGNNLIRDV